MSKATKVTFELKKNSPISLNELEYYVTTNDIEVAHDVALHQLKEDLAFLAMQYSESADNLINYYQGVEFEQIDLLDFKCSSLL